MRHLDGEPARSSARISRYAIDVGDARVRYSVAGSGPDVVLLHGLGGSAWWWRRNFRPLARFFTVYAVDLMRVGAPFRLAETPSLVVAWMDAVGLARASFVGHSMGGIVAADLAATHPHRVDRLVLVDAALPPASLRFSHIVGATRALWKLPPSLAPLLIFDGLLTGPVMLASATRQLLNTDIRSKLADVRAPTLVVWGDDDTLMPVELGEELVGFLADASLVTLPGAGHNPQWERAPEFNDLVGRFLGDVSADAG